MVPMKIRANLVPEEQAKTIANEIAGYLEVIRYHDQESA